MIRNSPLPWLSVERNRNTIYAEQLAIIAEMNSRGATINGEGCHPAVWVRQVLRIDRRPARELVDHAQALHSSRTPTGSEIDAALPATAQALQAGVLSPAHVRAIHSVTAQIPSRVRDDDKASAEQILVEAAEVIEPGQIVRLGKEILARLDPDGPEPKDDDPIRPRRFLRLRERVGRTEIYGELDPEAASVLTTVFEPLARRRGVEANGGVPDTRMPDERNADALIEAVRMAMTSPDMPTEAGEPVTLTVTIPLAELEQRARQAMLTEPAGMSVEELRRKACDANLIPAVLGAPSEVLDIGRKTRIIPTGIRRALILRDKGCAFPGCDRRPKACHAHHVRALGKRRTHRLRQSGSVMWLPPLCDSPWPLDHTNQTGPPPRIHPTRIHRPTKTTPPQPTTHGRLTGLAKQSVGKS